jgi:hypothetical protein
MWPDDSMYYCGNTMTQEDLLCDTCRDGCNAGIAWAGEDKPGYHMKLEGVQLEGVQLGFHFTLER